MTKQKKWFRAVAIVFAFLLAYASYDISRRTTFPGSKAQLKERIQKDYLDDDSTDNSTPDDLIEPDSDKLNTDSARTTQSDSVR